MSTHTWTEEHVEAYLAGGLTAQEAERLEAHVEECAECESLLSTTRGLECELNNLFAGVRPGPELEDRIMDRLRVEPAAPKPILSRWSARAVAAAAAVVFVGAFGALASSVADGNLPMPGGSRVKKQLAATSRAAGEADSRRSRDDAVFGDLVNEDPGLQSNLEAALPDLDRLEKQTVDAAVTTDNIGQPNAPRETAAGSSGVGGTGYTSSTGRLGDTRSRRSADPYPKLPFPSLPPSVTPVSGPIPPPTGIPTPVAPVPVLPVTSPTPTLPMGEGAQKPSDPKKDPGFDPSPEPTKRVILRSGNIEFEVPSFDAAAATVTKSVTGLKGAFIATINSDKLPNGKVKGSITVRTPPEHLDSLVLELRKELGKDGELKGVRISSQDVTKQYTDLESHLRAYRTMETRLIQIIKEGKGEIKQLLEAERELGTWRTKIEATEGELRYYANLAALSTLTITLTEKELRAAVSLTESERVQAGVEVDDVDKTYQEVLKAVLDAKGRITKSEVKQLAAGQFNASLNFEVPPEASGTIRDRLKQLGRIARLEIDRLQHVEGGTFPTDAKTKRGDTVFLVSIYNLANVAPRETALLQIAVSEVPKAFQTLREVVGKTTSRVFTAKFDEQDKQNITAQLDFEVRRTDEGIVRAALEAAGETFSRQLTRSPESDNVTDTKVLYRVTILSMSRLRPRETATMNVAVVDVPAAYQSLRDAIAKANGRILNAQINEQDRTNITAVLDLDVKRADEPAIRAAFDAAGEVLARQVTRAGESENVTDSKVRYTATLVAANRLKPRETTTLGLEVGNVDEAATLFAAQVAEVKGRQVDAKFSRESSGKTLAKLVFEVPLTAAAGVIDRFKAAGTVRVSQSVRDPQATEGRFATARIEVTLGNRDSIVSDEDGLGSQVRRGLSYSASVLLTSVTWVIFGLCVILPWAIIGYVVYRVVRRTFLAAPTPETALPPAPPTATA
ncbi:MAG: hypothetical protein C0467_22810 [Planctomycetaceae bacterium]|nr:hypothetical protein [Planctomycetaceae bacterium]